MFNHHYHIQSNLYYKHIPSKFVPSYCIFLYNLLINIHFIIKILMDRKIMKGIQFQEDRKSPIKVNLSLSHILGNSYNHQFLNILAYHKECKHYLDSMHIIHHYYKISILNLPMKYILPYIDTFSLPIAHN